MNHITSHRGRVYKFRILEGVFFFHQNSVRLHATLICMHAQGKFGESARLSLFLHAILSSLSVECLSQLPARRASHKHTPTGMWMGVDPAASCGLKNGHRICMVTSMGTESDGTSHVMSGTRPLPASSCRPLVLAKHVAKQIGRHSGRKHSKPGRSGGSALLSPVLKVMLEEHSTQRRWRTAEMSRSLMTLAVSSPNCPILQRSLMQGNSHRRLRLESTPSCQQRTGS